MTDVMTMLRRGAATVAALLVALLTALGGLLLVAGPAAAHGGDGRLEVVSTEPQADGTSVKVTVQLRYATDDHPAADATVTVAGEREGDAAPTDFTPVTLAASGPEGQYAGVVPIPAPGSWTLRVTSVEPPATASVPVSLAGTSGTVGSSTAPSTTADAVATGGAAPDNSASGPASDGPSSTMVTVAV
ncbi:MAG: hypothetical protein ACKO04_07165, partial [Actinomycetes bacterium]